MNEIPIEIIYKIKFWKIRSGVLNRNVCSHDAELILFGASNFHCQIILISARKSLLTSYKYERGWWGSKNDAAPSPLPPQKKTQPRTNFD